jgi:hypothetical protein
MPTTDLSDAELAAITAAIRRLIDEDKFPHAPHLDPLRSALAKLEADKNARHAPKGRFQIAFGHHRVEAARRRGLKQVPLIVRDLSDGDMLRFMGRENGEDYSTQFAFSDGHYLEAIQPTTPKRHPPNAPRT